MVFTRLSQVFCMQNLNSSSKNIRTESTLTGFKRLSKAVSIQTWLLIRPSLLKINFCNVDKQDS